MDAAAIANAAQPRLQPAAGGFAAGAACANTPSMDCRPSRPIVRRSVLAAWALALAGCSSLPGGLSLGATNIEPLEGNYQTLANCAQTQLTRRQAGKLTKVEEAGRVRLRSDAGWELSFVNEGPDVTRMEVTRGQVSEHFLAIARACSG
jgi:hypothetical protein